MVSIDTVRKNNSTLREYGPNLVAVFGKSLAHPHEPTPTNPTSPVGGTSGIGETTARAFVRSTLSPRVYLVGRSESRASQIIEELRASNPDGQITFVKGDVSRLHEVDEACKAIQAKEEKVNLLFLSAGILTTKGRDGMVMVSSFPVSLPVGLIPLIGAAC
jgi:hypothetical protein